MAQKGMNDAIYYGAVFIGSYTAYKMAKQGSFGDSAKKFANDLSTAWKGSSSSGATTKSNTPQTSKPATTGPTASMPAQAVTSLRDLGGVPLVWVSAKGVLQQDPAWVSRNAPGYPANSYGAGAVVFEQSNGKQLSYQGGGKLLDMDSGEMIDILGFIVAVA